MTSDSEDLCYGNATKKLKLLSRKSDKKRSNYREILSDTPEINRIINLVSASTSINNIYNLSDDDINQDNSLNKKSKPKKTDYPSDLSDGSDAELFQSTYRTSVRRKKSRQSKRVNKKTRVSNKPVKVPKVSDSNTNNSPIKSVRTKKKTKRKTTPPADILSEPLLQRLLKQVATGIQNFNNTITGNHISDPIDIVHTLVSPGRGSPARSRGSRNLGKRSRGRPPNISVQQQYPTISIGNTEEYHDKSEDIPLFSTKPKIVEEIVISDDDSDDNEEVTVHVNWQNFEVFKFNLRKSENLKQVFDFFAKKESVTEKRLFFAYNDVVLTCDDSPNSIKYNIAKFIEGGLISQDLINLVREHTSSEPSGIQIKFQCQSFKRPYELTVQPNEKLSLAMTKCAEHFEKPLYNLKFEFDGEHISGTATPNELELENGDCIDVRIVE